MCRVSYGQGLVVVCSFGNMFNDKSLGFNPANSDIDVWHDLDRAERARYDVLFALLRHLVYNEPIVLPERNVKEAEPRISVPLNRPPRATRRPSGAGGRDAGCAFSPRGVQHRARVGLAKWNANGRQSPGQRDGFRLGRPYAVASCGSSSSTSASVAFL